MVQELLYTSAERGLDLGTTGFCTVARTRGLSKRLERLLHDLSVYKWDLRSGHNPVVYMYTRANLDGQSLFILSRVAPAPADYSGRSNYFAHHVVLSPSELPQAGPVWLLRQPGFLEQQWDGQVKELPTGRAVPQGNSQPRPCTTWQRVTGDAGWAGLLLKYVSENATAPVYLIAEDSLPLLDLLEEVIALLPVEKRWQVTFTTRYIQLPGEVTCSVRVVSPGSEKIAEAKASPRKVDLTALRGHKPAEDPYTEAARRGQSIRASDQFILAADDPVPITSASFSQVQVGGPIRHNPGISHASPASVAAPASPPPPAPPPAVASFGTTSRQSARTPWWLVVLTLLHLSLTVALAVGFFYIRLENKRLDEQLQKANATQNPYASAVEDLREELTRLRNRSEENATQLSQARKDLARAIEQAKKLEEGANKRVKELEAKLAELEAWRKEMDGMHMSFAEVIRKSLTDVKEQLTKEAASKVTESLTKQGLLGQALDKRIQEETQKALAEAFDRIKPSQDKKFIKINDARKGDKILIYEAAKRSVNRMLVLAPNADGDTKHVVWKDKQFDNPNLQYQLGKGLRLECGPPNEKEKLELILHIPANYSKEELRQRLAGLIVLVLANRELRLIEIVYPQDQPGNQ